MASAMTLPKTIESARKRYLRIYREKFKGAEEERNRLYALAEAKILQLRKKAPQFYENKLPLLINQAASDLLICDNTTQTGTVKFNELHSTFLRILDELRRTQPQGEVNFQQEKDRIAQRQELTRKYMALRAKVEELESVEFCNDDIGDEEVDDLYSKVFEELDKKKLECKRLAILLAKLDGEKVEEEIYFQLQVEPRTCISRLTKEQRNKLESLIQEFIEQNKNRKLMYDVDKSHIDKILDQIGIQPGQFMQVERNQLSKEALDAYKTFFRNIAAEQREEFYDSLLRSSKLRPKEGVILESPDDIPEEVKQKLNDSKNIFQRQIEATLDKYEQIQSCDDFSNTHGEEVGDDDGEVANEEDEIEAIYVKQNPWLFARVKEEPRDDYENDAPSDDEMIVNNDVAADITGAGNRKYGDIPEDEDEDDDQTKPIRSSNGQVGNEEEEDDEVEDLGVVEPASKIEEIVISDSE